MGVGRIGHNRFRAVSILNFLHELFRLGLVERRDKIRDGYDSIGFRVSKACNVVFAESEEHDYYLRLETGRGKLLDESNRISTDNSVHQYVGAGAFDFAQYAGEIFVAKRYIFLADGARAYLACNIFDGCVHLLWPNIVAADKKKGITVVLPNIWNQWFDPLLRYCAVAGDVSVADTAFIVRGIEQRRLEAIDCRHDCIAISTRHRTHDGVYIIALNELEGPFDRRLGISLVISADVIDVPIEQPSLVVDLVDRELCALIAL